MSRSMSPGSVVLAGCALIALVSAPPEAQSTADASFLVVNARVFDGERLLEETDVAVESGTIRAVGRDLTGWERLAVIGGANSTIMPGLIDAHAHVASIADPQQALQFGVTTLLDMGAANVPQEQVFEVRTAARTATDMAEVFSAGFLASARRPAGSTRPLVTSIDDAVRFADDAQLPELRVIIRRGIRPRVNCARANELVHVRRQVPHRAPGSASRFRSGNSHSNVSTTDGCNGVASCSRAACR
jgi:hypothetical protein